MLSLKLKILTEKVSDKFKIYDRDREIDSLRNQSLKTEITKLKKMLKKEMQNVKDQNNIVLNNQGTIMEYLQELARNQQASLEEERNRTMGQNELFLKFPINSIEELETLNEEMTENPTKFISYIKQICPSGIATPSFDRIFGKNIIEEFNYLGTNGKKGFRDFKSLDSVLRGYFYIRNKIIGDLHKWRCIESQLKTDSCRGYVFTYVNNGKHYFKQAKNHNHPNNEHSKEMISIISRIKDRAISTKDLPTKIHDEELLNLTDKIKEKFPSRENILNLINRIRRKVSEISQPKQTIKVENGNNEISHCHEPFVEPGSEVEIIIFHKGTKKLNLNGYLYCKNAIKHNVHYWTCEEKHSGKCRGCATTIEKDEKHYLRTTKPHNHLAKAGNQKEIASVLNRVKERALNSDDGPIKIYNEFVLNLSKELKAVMPTKEAVVMIIKRHRRKFRPTIPRNPNSHQQKIYPPEVVEIIDQMKKKIATTTEGPVKVYNAFLANVPQDLREKFPQRTNVLQALKRHRRKCKQKGMFPNDDCNDDDNDSGSEDEIEFKPTLPVISNKETENNLNNRSNNNPPTLLSSMVQENSIDHLTNNTNFNALTPENSEIFWRFGEHPKLFQ